MIIIWNCGTWCWDRDWIFFTKKGDPHARLIVPDCVDDSEIDDQVIAFLCGDQNELIELNLGGK